MEKRNQLIHLRKDKGLLQSDIAEKLGISQQLVSFIEQGKRKPSLVIAKEMEALFNVPMEELFPDIFLKSNTTKCNI